MPEFKKDKIVVMPAITTIAAASITNLGYEPRNSLSAYNFLFL